MGLTLDRVVPWGRSFNEYVQMFDLTAADLQRRILGCADGPAAFNAELTQRGGQVVSLDPIYTFTTEQIRDRIAATADTILDQVRDNQADYVWTAIASVADLKRVRLAAMDQFLADFEAGKAQGRYVTGALPHLPWADDAFDLALCSHCLFLYSDHFSTDFHQQAVLELLRVAPEVRIFPLLTLDGQPSPHLVPVLETLQSAGIQIATRQVTYEFQRGGNQLLVLKRQEQLVEAD